MPQPRGKLQKRPLSPPHSSPEGENPQYSAQHVHHRPMEERRSKHVEDLRVRKSEKGRGKARLSTPPAKKRKVVDVSSDFEFEDFPHVRRSRDLKEIQQHSSRTYVTVEEKEEEEEDDDDVDTDDECQAWEPVLRRRASGNASMKKPVSLDENGLPYGKMKACLADDLKVYAKDLDPTSSWERQPTWERKRLFERLYADWDMSGESDKLNEKWMRPIITKVLINVRWRLNALIDANKPKPAEVSTEQWNCLMTTRATEAAQKRSEHMRSISKGKGAKALQLKAIEKDAIIRLSIQHKRAPYESEITEEVFKQFHRQEEEKRIMVPVDHGKDIAEVEKRVNEVDNTIARLEGKMDLRMQRFEDLLTDLLNGQSKLRHTESVEVTAPSLSARVTDMPSLVLQSKNMGAVQEDSVLIPIHAEVDHVGTGVQENFVDKGLPDEVVVSIGGEDNVVGLLMEDDGPGEGVADVTEFVLNVNAEVGSKDVQEDADVYAIGGPQASQQPIKEGPNAKDQQQTEQEDMNLGGESVCRPRRHVKSVMARAKVSKVVVPSKSPKMTPAKPNGLPKAGQGFSKIGNVKKPETGRKK